MNRWGIKSLLRAGFGVLTLVAIVAQLKVTADAGVLNPVNFFSYFTIQSNLIGAAVLLYPAYRGDAYRSATLVWWRGAASVYLTITFFVVIFLLSHTDVGLQLPWVDFTLHKVIPVAVVADFVLDPPGSRLALGDGLRWLIYPLIWLAYTLIRGPIAGWYPYPFLDPANGGYGSVAVTSLGVLVAGGVLCWVFTWIGNARGSGSRATPA